MSDDRLANGSLVKINNREHVWHNEVAIIRDCKECGAVVPTIFTVEEVTSGEVSGEELIEPYELLAKRFYRIELFGRLIWIPEHWLQSLEDEPT